jgi:hypothetical protein
MPSVVFRPAGTLALIGLNGNARVAIPSVVLRTAGESIDVVLPNAEVSQCLPWSISLQGALWKRRRRPTPSRNALRSPFALQGHRRRPGVRPRSSCRNALRGLSHCTTYSESSRARKRYLRVARPSVVLGVGGIGIHRRLKIFVATPSVVFRTAGQLALHVQDDLVGSQCRDLSHCRADGLPPLPYNFPLFGKLASESQCPHWSFTLHPPDGA